MHLYQNGKEENVLVVAGRLVVFRLQIINSDTSSSNQGVTVTIFGSDCERCVVLFDRNYSIFTLICEISVTISFYSQLKQEFAQAF